MHQLDRTNTAITLPPLFAEFGDKNAYADWMSEQESLITPPANLEDGTSLIGCSNGMVALQEAGHVREAERRLSTRRVSPMVNHTIPWSKQKTRCPTCGLKLLKKTLQRHIQDRHVLQRSSFKCADCGAKFKRQDILDRHIGEQHGEASGEAGTVECVYCHELIRERALNDHLRSQKCLAARKSAQLSAMDPKTRSYTVECSYLPSSWIGLESVIDSETAYCFARAALDSVSNQMPDAWMLVGGIINEASGNEVHLYEFRAFRELAVRALLRELNTPSAQTFMRAYLVAIIEYEAFERHLTFSGMSSATVRRLHQLDVDASAVLLENVQEAAKRLGKCTLGLPYLMGKDHRKIDLDVERLERVVRDVNWAHERMTERLGLA